MLFLEWVKMKQRTGFSPIALIVGEQRVGKTCTALYFAEELDKDFDIDKQMFFDVYSYAKATQKYNKKVLVLDEAGIELDTYRYSDFRQRAFSHIIQSQAYKNNTLLIVLPHAVDIAKCHRRHVKALMVVTSRRVVKWYMPFVYYNNMNDDDIKEKYLSITPNLPLPSKGVFEHYKSKFEKQIKGKILENEIAMMESKFNRELEKTTKQSHRVHLPPMKV